MITINPTSRGKRSKTKPTIRLEYLLAEAFVDGRENVEGGARDAAIGDHPQGVAGGASVPLRWGEG